MLTGYHEKQVQNQFWVLNLIEIKVKSEFFGMFLACHVPPAFSSKIG